MTASRDGVEKEMLGELLHPRIKRRCSKLFADGHYADACHRAFEEVAAAVKEKAGVTVYGRRLYALLRVGGKGVKLHTPFGEPMQQAAARYFRGAFQYYRNYAAHDGRNVDRPSCLRGLVAASELLELVGASDLSFAEIGGVQGLVDVGVFSSRQEVLSLLDFLDAYRIVDDAVDGLFQCLAERGFTETQMRALIDCGLVEYKASAVPPSAWNPDEVDTIGSFEMTPLGRAAREGKTGT